MPAKEWSLRATNTAKFGLDWSQSGTTLRVTVRKLRTQSITFNNFARTLAVTVTGNSTFTTSSSTDNSFPSSMAVGSWVATGVTNRAFTLPLGVSSVTVSVVWNQPATDGWIGQSYSTSIPVTPVYDPPDAPTDVTATRNSDTSIGLTWTRNVSSDAPYTSQVVYRSENGGSFVETATLAGAAASYTFTSVANRKYEFRVQARNSAASTNSATSNTILTTPAAFGSLTAATVSNGIRVRFSARLVPYTEAQVVLERSTNSGEDWATVSTTNASSFSTSGTTDVVDTDAPTSGSVVYRARVNTNGGTQGTLYSGYTVSNELTLNTPPGAPTNLAPSGTVDVVAPVTLSWTHTVSSDGAAQSSRHIQYSTDGGSSQTDIVSGNSTASTYDWTVDTGDFSAGDTILWRVRTAGSQPGTYGDWSEWQTLTLRQSMAVTITAPEDEDTWEGGDIPVEWSTTAPWGTASQVAYRIVLEDADLVVYDSGTVTSTDEAALIPASAQTNLTEYTITVTVTDNYGLTSLPESVTVETDFLAPEAVGLSWEYDDTLGQLVLTPTFDGGDPESELDDTASWMLERSLDGVTWAVLGSWEGDAPVADPHVRIGAVSWYRTTGFTALGVAGERTVFEIPAADVRSRWGWLTYGDVSLRFGWSQSLETSAGRASAEYEIEGVDYPAAVFGAQKSHRLSVSGKLLHKSRPGAGGISDGWVTGSDAEFEELAKDAGVCLFRDGDGRYWDGRVSDVRVAPRRRVAGQPDEAVLTFSVSRVSV